MFCFLTVRKVKPGTEEQYVEAARPHELPPGFQWGYQVQNLADESMIISFGLIDRKLEFFSNQMSKDGDFIDEMERREKAMEPFVEETVVNGVFKVVDELKEDEF